MGLQNGTAIKADQEDSCDVSYRLAFDGFRVRGKNWPDAKLGANGVKYQWYAQGPLPIGTKACVGNAVQSAGGSSKVNCLGPGK